MLLLARPGQEGYYALRAVDTMLMLLIRQPIHSIDWPEGGPLGKRVPPCWYWEKLRLITFRMD